MPVKDKRRQQQNRILAGLQETVADMISELDLQAVLHKAVERTAELIGADIVTIHIYDPPTGRVHAAAGYGLWDEETFQQHELGRGKVALLVANKGEPVVAEDVSASELKGSFSAREGVKSAAGFPLKVGADFIGVLFVNYRKRHKFEQEEVETLVSFGSLVAVAIGNANLIEQERQRADAMDLLQKVSAKISAPLDVEETLALIIEGAMRLTGTESGVIHLVDEAKQAVIRSYEAPEDFGHLPPRLSQTGMTWEAVSTGQTIAVSDITKDERVNPAMAEKGVRAIIGTPLKVEDKTIGVFFLNDSEPHEFTEYERELLSTLASQAAIAIQNARLLANLRRRAKGHQTLNKVGTTLAGILDEEAILKSVARAVADTLDCTHCTVFRVEDGNLVVRAAEGNRGWSLPLGRTFSVGQGVAGWVAQMRIATLVAHTDKDERFDPGWSAPQPDPQSLVVVPILLEGEVFGVISAEHDQATAFDEQDQRLLETLALQTGQALQNARLLQRERTARQQAETLREISGAISSERELKEVAEKVLDELGRVVEFRRASLQLIREDADSRVLLAARGFDVKAVDRWFLRPISLDRLASRLMRSREPLILSEPSKDPDWGIHPATADIKSWIGIPLVHGQETIGLLTLDHDQPGFYTQTIKDQLTSFANRVAIDIWNVRLFDSAQRRIRDLRIINEVVQVISRKLDTKDLLQTIVAQIADKLNCTHCTLFFPQEKKGELLLVPEVTHGRRSEEIMTRRFKLDEESLVGWVFLNRESLVLSDSKQDRRFAPARERREQPRSMLVAPVKVGDQTIGVISADQDRYGWFSESDRRLVDALALQAGIAIERARGLELLQDVGNRIIGAPELNNTLRRIVVGAIELTNATSGTIYLISEDGRSVTDSFLYPPGFDHPPPRMVREDGITRQVIATGEMQIFPDIRQDDRINPVLHDLGIRSMIAIPLKFEERVIGVLYLNDEDPHDFTETEISLLSTLASQAAIAIENARLFQELDERATQLTRLQEVTTVISAEAPDIDRVSHLIVDSLGSIFPGASCAIRLYDSRIDTFRPQIATGVMKDLVERPPRAGGMSRYVVRTRAPRYLEGDALSKPYDGGPTSREAILEKGVKATAYLPLLGGTDVIGILYVYLTTPCRFSQSDKRILELFADQAAIAIENARLFEEATKRAEGVAFANELGRLLSATRDVVEIPRLLVKETLEAFNAEAGSLALINAETQEIEFQFALDYKGTKGLEVLKGYKMPLDKGIAGAVVRSGKPVVSNNVQGDPRWHKEVDSVTGFTTKSILAVPLIYGKQVIGVIEILNKRDGSPFLEREKDSLTALALSATIAIENARLYRDLERRIRQLEVLPGIYEKIITAGIEDIDRILDLLYKEASKVLDLSNAQVQIAFYDEAKDEVSFPLAIEQDSGEIIDVVRWNKREPQYRKAGEDEVVEQFKPRVRRDPPGLTEYVIRTKEPLLIVENFEQKAADLGIKVWSTFGRLDRPTHSWIGVPMMVGGRVIGVISIQSLEQEHAFDEGQQELLTTVASQAAVAIENARLYQEARSEVIATKQLATLGIAIAALQHRINNSFNIIVPNVTRLRKRIDMTDETHVEILDIIERNARYTSNIIARIQEPLREIEIQDVDVNAVLSDVVGKAREQWLSEPDGPMVEVMLNLDDSIPRIPASIGQIAEVFRNLIDNAYRAMEKGGQLVVTSDRAEGAICVRVRDRGPGIPLQVQERLFVKPVPSKDPSRGAGLGLWLSRLILQSIGGDVIIETSDATGTTMLVEIPVPETGVQTPSLGAGVEVQS